MWGVVIGLGVALALTPICPLAVIVLLSVQHGVRKAWAFFLGELLVLAVICAAAVAPSVRHLAGERKHSRVLRHLVAGVACSGSARGSSRSCVEAAR